MFILVFDIFNQPGLLFDGVGKGSIALLSAIKIGEYPFVLYKSRASQFDVFDQGSQCNRGMKMGYNMQIVFYAVDPVEVTVIIFQNTPYLDKCLRFFFIRTLS